MGAGKFRYTDHMETRAGSAGYQEVDHTADWQLFVWAPTQDKLFIEAAKGMYALTGVKVDQARVTERTIHLEAGDLEGLLVGFLGELLFYGEEHHLAFSVIDIHIVGTQLDARLAGERIVTQAKEIKAVTYHNLAIENIDHQYQVSIVFDV
jgi:SHS2 domain-containing protein